MFSSLLLLILESFVDYVIQFDLTGNHGFGIQPTIVYQVDNRKFRCILEPLTSFSVKTRSLK